MNTAMVDYRYRALCRYKQKKYSLKKVEFELSTISGLSLELDHKNSEKTELRSLVQVQYVLQDPPGDPQSDCFVERGLWFHRSTAVMSGLHPKPTSPEHWVAGLM